MQQRAAIASVGSTGELELQRGCASCVSPVQPPAAVAAGQGEGMPALPAALCSEQLECIWGETARVAQCWGASEGTQNHLLCPGHWLSSLAIDGSDLKALRCKIDH